MDVPVLGCADPRLCHHRRVGEDDEVTLDGLEAHIRDFFTGHTIGPAEYDLGDGTRGAVAGLRVIEVAPGPRAGSWVYLTAGASVSSVPAREFILTAPTCDPRFADLVAMTAFYHGGPQPHPLDVGHGVPIGEPWLPGSACDRFLVSPPYPHGPVLEHCALPNGHRARFLWLLPITATEMAYARTHGLEALEGLFEEAAINAVDPSRTSVG